MKKNFRSLELQAKKYLNSYSSGIHATGLKDSLIEVDVVRQYQPGDKRLDSKSSLKTGTTMSRVFNPERSLNLYIILDLSSSQYTKLDSAIVTALYLCYLGDMCNEKVGLCSFSDHVISLLDVTEDYSSAVGSIEKALNNLKMDSPTSVDDAMKRVSSLSLTNSLVVLISDFCYDLTSVFVSSVKKISSVPTNSFLSLVLHNPNDWLQNLSESFKMDFRDAETGKMLSYKSKDVSESFNSWSKELKDKLVKCHSDVVFLDVQEKKFLLPLIKYLMRS
jgi:uncharacterized protein (DUF58 family)